MQAVNVVTEEPSNSEHLPRSGCPVSLGLDIFGDRWTLLIVRDLMFTGKRHYREMLHSSEHISTNILADRLKMLLAEGIVTKSGDPTHLQKVVYRLTEKGIALYPVLMAISEWSYRYRPVGESYLPAGEVDAEAQMAELRRTHLEVGVARE
jgi:DNA-binding HxlR family transcriptional regulator